MCPLSSSHTIRVSGSPPPRGDWGVGKHTVREGKQKRREEASHTAKQNEGPGQMKTSQEKKRKEKREKNEANGGLHNPEQPGQQAPPAEQNTTKTATTQKQPHTKDAGLPPKPARRAQDAERLGRPGGGRVLAPPTSAPRRLATPRASPPPRRWRSTGCGCAPSAGRMSCAPSSRRWASSSASSARCARRVRPSRPPCASPSSRQRPRYLGTARRSGGSWRRASTRRRAPWRAQRRRSAMRWGGTAAPRACGARRWPRPWPTAPPPSRCRTDGTSSRAGSPRSPCSMRSSRCRPATRTRRSELRPRHRSRAC